MMDVGRNFEGIAQSGIFLVLGTASYLQEIRGHGGCYQQVMMAKALGKPVILMLDQRLLPSEHDEIRRRLSGIEIIGSVLFDSEHLDDRVANELREILEKWKRESAKEANR